MRLPTAESLVLLVTAGSARLLTVPTIPFEPANGSLSVGSLRSIVVDEKHADAVNEDGETFIPPTLMEFARTFATDFSKTLGADLTLATGTAAETGSIFLTLDNATDFLDAAGRHTSEGYSFSVSGDGVTIAGASPLGAWWGTRTLLQAAVLNNGTIPAGSAVDAPGWATRGVMLDAGRHYYPPEFLMDMCSYLSFFKQNTFHLHLSDNMGSVYLDNYDFEMSLYAAFRLDSDAPALTGLNRRKNESYTRDVFETMQHTCASRGVTIIPEIETPGHALVITQWKPELALSTDYSMLNLSHPDTLPTVRAIWHEFLPWFHTKTVHIGADEYDATLAADYNDFVNALSAYIRSSTTPAKSTRIWGTFPPSAAYTNNIPPAAASIQHWEFFEDDPLRDYLARNYSVLNSDDAFYIVNKWSGSYPQSLNRTRIFHGDPETGGSYAPYVFDTNNATNNPPREHPGVLGHVAALWNDCGPNATTYSEAYYAWRDGLPALADKQWGGDLVEDEYDAVFAPLHDAVPAQNLDRRIPSVSETVLKYDFANVAGTVVPDASGNGYDGAVVVVGGGDDVDVVCGVVDPAKGAGALRLDGACFVQTPLVEGKGRDYTLSFGVWPEAPGGALFGSGGGVDGSALLAGNGSSESVMLVAAGEKKKPSKMKLTSLICLSAVALGTVLAAPHSQPPTTKGRRSNTRDYDIVMVPDADIASVLAVLNLNSHMDDILATYNNTLFKGFSGALTPQEATLLSAMPNVRVVAEVVEVNVAEETETRDGVPWGLQRISQRDTIHSRNFPLDRTYTYRYPSASTPLGAGIDVYVLDTGIYTSHTEFDGRASMGFTYWPANTTDGHGHGTHCAATIAGASVGVASAANVVGVKVLSDAGPGPSNALLAGLDWVAARHGEGEGRTSVMSMSLGFEERSEAIEAAVAEMVRGGVHAALAAGNSAKDACTVTPAALGGRGSAVPVVTVGASTYDDQVADFSNTGSCVDVYAPGVWVVSAGIEDANHPSSE
ncbi:putative glycosyl hydrolase family 20 [Diplodia seriata]|uniref:beta-N-acetylhexosaminidase n=1 Tax=Diplodia seriata TaxID=420778 RepID=A0A0G2E1H2_9PEZI|nr:putative glycosyl hydrolase family 20 [Diplodia seriata]